LNSISKNFALFFLVSIVLWFLTKLSKDYDSTVTYPVTYQNLPDDKLMQKAPPSTVDIHIKATGFKILSGKLFPKTLEVNAGNVFAKSKNDYFLLLSQQRLGLQKQLNNGVSIDHFIQDSVTMSLGVLSRKKVPVKLVSELTYDAGYHNSGNLVITPDSVEVSGPESMLDTLRFVPTSTYVEDGINESIHKDLPLKPFESSQNMGLSVQKVTIDLAVEKYTEGTLKVPFTVLNLPNNLTINTFPKEVELTFKVSLSQFNQIQTTSFLVECDYQLSVENQLSYLIPKVTKQSELVKNVKIAPNRIDFVIEK
jgi:YbbR domain-containing protein